MPRPKKPKPAKPATPGVKPTRGVAANTLLSIRLTPAEAKQLRTAAGSQPLAAWARSVLLSRSA